MTLNEAIAQQPAWIGYWLNWMMFAVFILPAVLLIWRKSRVAGIATLISSLISAVAVGWMYQAMGYVKLLGLPHLILWTPLVFYIYRQIRRDDMPTWPRRVIPVVLATMLISLAFDYVDAARYLFGAHTPSAMPAAS